MWQKLKEHLAWRWPNYLIMGCFLLILAGVAGLAAFVKHYEPEDPQPRIEKKVDHLIEDVHRILQIAEKFNKPKEEGGAHAARDDASGRQ